MSVIKLVMHSEDVEMELQCVEQAYNQGGNGEVV